MKIKLPIFFKPLRFSELLRVGNKNDGGYVISKKSLLESDCLISLGLNDDCSFEEDFKKYNDCEVFSFDNTVHNKFWIKKIANDFLNLIFLDFNNFIKNNHIYLYFRYMKFFSQKGNTHIKKNISRKGFFGPKIYSSNSIDFIEAFNSIDKNNVFLKIDIEGYEYRFLDQILEIQHKLSGLAIEFHACDLHLEKIKNFIYKFELKLIHLHHNNRSAITNNSLPAGLELSFATEKNTEIRSIDTSYPNKYDSPNNSNLKDLEIKFNEN